MITALILTATVAVQPADGNSVQSALLLCRPRIERKLSADISSIDVQASSGTNGWTIIRGPVTAPIGMGKPAPGHANTHHLIRRQFEFICWVHDSRVEKLTIKPLR